MSAGQELTMNHDYAQRRRVALAVAVTAIAAPAAFLLNRDGEQAAGGEAPLGTIVVTVAPAPGQTSPHDDGAGVTGPLGTAPVGYLEGDTIPDDHTPAQIAIPRLPESIRGVASFSSSIDSTLRCHAKGVPFSATLTVTNLDNSRSVQCVASVGGAEPETDVVLATDTFAQIADLTDAPVPVQITWTDP